MPCLGVFNVVPLGDTLFVTLATLAGLGFVTVGLFCRCARLRRGVLGPLASAITVGEQSLEYVCVKW